MLSDPRPSVVWAGGDSASWVLLNGILQTRLVPVTAAVSLISPKHIENLREEA